ncbi:AlbA family DNA-binding domain-containing protein [Nocardia noduli]|uniref:AlbA family DNA-binding domain-containing protein n=1 Tax=Nocardia noduli TaxID=2815722 RepID=UPI001C22B53E|nr:ATP-binding protein [Nocardia noduli]
MAAIWRNRDLEQITGAPLDENGLTAQGIEKIVAEYPDEAMQVEYKSRRDLERISPKAPTDPPPYPWNPLQEHAKDICAPANSRGAIVIYGVEDSGELPGRLRPFEDGDPAKLIEQYRKDIRRYCSPTPRFDMFPVRTDDRSGFYIVAIVPPSPSAPHAVLSQTGKSGRGQLYYFVRAEGESHIRAMAEHEVAELYGQRSRGLETRRQHVTRVWEEGAARVREHSDNIWAAVSIVPDAPRDDALTPSTQQEIKDWDNNATFPDCVLGLVPAVQDNAFPEMGMLVYTQLLDMGDDVLAPGAATTYRELHANGSGYAAINMRDASEDPTAPCDLDEDSLIDTLAALTVHLLAWTTSRNGRWGNATINAGIIGTDKKGNFDISVRLIDQTGHGSGRGRRIVHRPPHIEVAAHLEEIDSTQSKLRVAYTVASRILQRFGVLEPSWLAEDGAIVATEMMNPQKPRARQWAEQHDVEFIEWNSRAQPTAQRP